MSLDSISRSWVGVRLRERMSSWGDVGCSGEVMSWVEVVVVVVAVDVGDGKDVGKFDIPNGLRLLGLHKMEKPP